MGSVLMDGSTVRWREAGNGGEPRTVVFLHGAGGSSLLWLAQIRALAGCARAIAVDLPGHGQSGGAGLAAIGAMRDFVLRFVDALGFDRVVLAGHSMGGAVALDFALIHPDRLAGIALVSTGAKLGVSPAILAAIEHEWPTVPRLMRDVAFGPNADDDLRARVSDLMLSTPQAVALSDFRACNDFDLRDRLREIDVPALVACGDADLLTPMKYSEFLAERLPRATLVRVPGAGHMLPVEAPAMLNDALRAFAESLDGPG